NDYTDVAIQQLVGFDVGGINYRLGALEDRFDGLDRRVRQQDRRIDRMGAMSAAMLNMAINAAGTQSPRGRIAVGAGFQGGEQGVSVGYGNRSGRTVSFSGGVACGSGESAVGIGFGVGLCVRAMPVAAADAASGRGSLSGGWQPRQKAATRP